MANFPGFLQNLGKTAVGTVLNATIDAVTLPFRVIEGAIDRTADGSCGLDHPRNSTITTRTVRSVLSRQYDTRESSRDENNGYSLAEDNKRMKQQIEKQSRDMRSLHEELDRKEKELGETPTVSAARRTSSLELEGNNIGVFGLTSRGKSTLVNSLLNKQVAKVGAGETTTEIKAYAGCGFCVWDVPGQNDTVTYEKEEYISLIKGLTHRIILIQSAVKENINLMRLLDDLELNYYVVVNKFDTVDDNEQEDFKEQIEREIIEANLQEVANTFFVSAKYPNRFPDWLEMVNLLTE